MAATVIGLPHPDGISEGTVSWFSQFEVIVEGDRGNFPVWKKAANPAVDNVAK